MAAYSTRRMPTRGGSGGGGAAGSAAMAAASVINNTVTQLFKNKMYKAQADKTKLEGRLAQLSTEQQFVLASRLNDAKNDNERFGLLQDAVSKIDVATVESNAEILKASIEARAKETQTTAIIIGAAVILVIGAYYFINKK